MEHEGGAVQVASRPYALAAAALAATSAVVAMPAAPQPSQLPVRSIETRLVDADSVLNIPINLFDDIANIPYNEVQALGTTADSLFFGANWWVGASTNLWGIDPGDTSHVASVISTLLPFPALDDGDGGLEYQIDGLLAAELPVSASCDAQTCAPINPSDVVTGSTSIDHDIGFLEALTGQTSFGLFDNWFQVPLSTLMSGYTFDTEDDPGVIDPSGVASNGFGFDNGGSNPFEGGTVYDPTTGQYDMPWDGLTYTLNPLQPFENFYDSLLAPPSTSGLFGTGIDLPTLTEFTQALQAVSAGLVVDFDPFVPGSPACATGCDIPASLTVPALVQDIGNLDPGNPMINEWLAGLAAGTDNIATPSQIQDTIALLQTGTFNLTPTELAQVDAELASINPELPILLTNAGIYTDPGYLAYTDGSSTTFESVYGGDDPSAVAQDLQTLLTNNDTNLSELSNLSVLEAILVPQSAASTSADSGSAVDADLSSLLGSSISTAAVTELTSELSSLLSSSIDPSTFATDLSTLVASLF
jgi:hypothetical protein